MADCDATFHGSLALILCNAARVMAQVYEQNTEILGNAPFRIAEACEGVNIANAENTSTAYQSKVIITSLEATVSELSKEAEVSRKDRSSQHRWMITFGIVCVACSALTITETRICERAASGIQTDRFALLANAQLLLDAQKLVLARGKLNSDMTEVQRKWKQLQDEWKVQQTPELVELRKQLEAEYSTLKLRAQNILAKEEAEYGKL